MKNRLIWLIFMVLLLSFTGLGFAGFEPDYVGKRAGPSLTEWPPEYAADQEYKDPGWIEAQLTMDPDKTYNNGTNCNNCHAGNDNNIKNLLPEPNQRMPTEDEGGMIQNI